MCTFVIDWYYNFFTYFIYLWYMTKAPSTTTAAPEPATTTPAPTPETIAPGKIFQWQNTDEVLLHNGDNTNYTLHLFTSSLSFLSSTTYTEYTYTHLGPGFCGDWIYLPEGGYPARLISDDALYDADPIQECLNRCLDANGEAGQASTENGGTGTIGNRAFYLSTENKCACAISDCSSLTPDPNYASYAIISGKH